MRALPRGWARIQKAGADGTSIPRVENSGPSGGARARSERQIPQLMKMKIG